MALSSGKDFMKRSAMDESSVFPYLPIRKLFCSSIGGSVGMFFIGSRSTFLFQGKLITWFAS